MTLKTNLGLSKRVSRFLILVVIFLVTTSSFGLNFVKAAETTPPTPLSKFTPYNQARIYNAKQALIFCMSELKYSKTDQTISYTIEEIQTGKFLNNRPKKIGPLLNNSDDINCSDMPTLFENAIIPNTKIFDFFYSQPALFIQDTNSLDKFKYNPILAGQNINDYIIIATDIINQQYNKFYSGVSDSNWPKEPIAKANENKQLLTLAFQDPSKFPTPIPSTPLTISAAYFMLKPSFEKSCEYTITTANINHDTYSNVNENTGEVTSQKILFNTDKNKDAQVSYGWGLPFAADYVPGKLSCKEALNLLNNYASVASGDTKNILLQGATTQKTVPEDAVEPTCESEIKDIGWLVCQILRPIDSLIKIAEETIINQFEVKESFQTEDIRSVWNNMARLASGLLVMVALIMIISTALGFNVVSAYTMKKVLPKIVIGSIGIWLSWTLVTGYISIMNTIGEGLQQFIYLSVDESVEKFTLGDILGTAAGQQGFARTSGATVLFSAAAIYLASSIGVVGLLTGALTALIAFVTGIIVLGVRQLLIVVFLVFSPLAFAAWILPGTNKYWSKWFSILNKLLIMYPLFAGLFAIGKVVAYIYTNTILGKSSGGGLFLLNFLIPLIAYLFPFIYLPKLFKSAGGILNGVTNAVNKTGNRVTGGWQNTLKGATEARNKRRETEKIANQRQRQATGELFGRSIPGVAGISRFNDRLRKGRPVINAGRSKARNTVAEGSETIGAIQNVEKELARFSSDKEIIKAIANGGVSQIKDVAERQRVQERLQSTGAIKYIGNADARNAAVLVAASNGDASVEMIQEMVNRTYTQENPSVASFLVSQATKGSKDKGNLEVGTLKLDYTTGKVGHKGFNQELQEADGSSESTTARNESIVSEIASMTPESRVQALSKLEFDSKTNSWKIKDSAIAEALQSSGQAIIQDILNNPTIYKITQQQRAALTSLLSDPSGSTGTADPSGSPSTEKNDFVDKFETFHGLKDEPEKDVDSETSDPNTGRSNDSTEK